jgi:1,4-alpha-glucan branching enzyme
MVRLAAWSLGAALLLAAPGAAQATRIGGAANHGAPARWAFTTFAVNVPDHVPRLRVELSGLVGDGAELYVRAGAPATALLWDFSSQTPNTSDEQVVVDGTSAPALTSGSWFAGVWAPIGHLYTLDFHFEVAPAVHAGLGANLFDDGPGLSGVGFRLWAPNADSVHVAGTFNGWASSAAPLADEGNGQWSLDYRGVTAGAQYKYVVRNGAQTLWKVDPRACAVTSSAGNGVVYAHDRPFGPFQMPAWDDLVIYELHVGTFEDAPGGAVGTFDSARARLPLLQDLGVTAVELMPTCEFPGDYSWGYNPSHPFAVEAAYGGTDGLAAFVDDAHTHGIAVILDVIYNHWGPTDLDLWRLDGWGLGGWGGIYFYNDERAITPWGDTRPDFGRGEVRQYIRDNALYWLQELWVDGLRWDSTSNVRRDTWGDSAHGWSLLQWVNNEVDAAQGWKIQIAEDMFDAPNHFITRATGAGGAGFDAQWDALFVHPIRAAVETPNDADRSMWAVRDALAHSYNGSALQRVIYTESHDEVANGRARVPEEIWPGNAASWASKKRSTLAAALVMTAPGIPMLFQGQELLEDGFFSDDDPVDWSKLVTFAGIRELYKDLIALRRDLGGNTRGLKGNNTSVHHVNDGDKVIAFHRWDQGGPGDDVIVVANFKNQAFGNYRVGLPRPGAWHVRFNSDWAGYDAAFGDHPSNSVMAQQIGWDGMSYSAELSFGPYTAIVLSQ